MSMVYCRDLELNPFKVAQKVMGWIVVSLVVLVILLLETLEFKEKFVCSFNLEMNHY